MGVGSGARGRALLVEGLANSHAGTTAMGELCEVLLASQCFETVRFLTPRAAHPKRPSRLALRVHIEELLESGGRLSLVALSGRLFSDRGDLAFTAPQSNGASYAADSVPLAWLAESLAERSRLLLFLELEHAGAELEAEAILSMFRESDPARLVAVAPVGSNLVRTVADALAGGAAIPSSGMVSFDSLNSFLADSDGVVVSGASSTAELLVPPSPLSLFGFARAARPGGLAASELVGRTLPGQFYLEAVIGSGSFGTVYAARQLTVGRDVAVKVVDASTPATAELFVNEVRAVGRVTHDNVVGIHQADITADGLPFCAMELLAGPSLREEMDAGPVDQARAVGLVEQLLAALAAAHCEDVIHGDVKPENLILAGDGGDARLVLVDFGLASLHTANAQAAGGTPAYMATEQLLGRLDHRSDLFAAALILHELLVGKLPARSPAAAVDPSIEPRLRGVLARALAEDVDRRFATAQAFAAALAGESESADEPVRASPFRAFSSYTEADEGVFYGRTQWTRDLVAQILIQPILILTAPSGVGKTSLLRAALIPRLRKLGFDAVYHECRAGERPPRGPGDVLVYDQLEALFLSAAGERNLDELLASLGWDDHECVILGVREDFLGRLMEHLSRWEQPRIERLPPLRREGARQVIARPLADRNIEVDPDAVEQLLDELQRAAAELGPRMGWGTGDFVYPPHLQLVCASLYEQIRQDRQLAVHHLEGLRFSDLISEHLRRLLDGELSDRDVRIARCLLADLIGPDDTRVARDQSELFATLPGEIDGDDAIGVLEFLRARGLLLPGRALGGDRTWELAHDSLVPRLVEWLDLHDLDRRRARELVRHHLGRSTPDQLYLLSRDTLREVERFPGLLGELDALSTGRCVTASELARRSRRALRRRRATMAVAAAATLAVLIYIGAGWVLERRAQAREQMLSAANLGRFTLVLEPFDWDGDRNAALEVSASALELPDVTFYDRDPESPDDVGRPLDAKLSRAAARGSEFVIEAEVRGGPGFLSIASRGRPGRECGPSWIRLRWLPGYVDRAARPEVRVVYPTCAATVAGTVEIPGGEFIRGGPGEPPVGLPGVPGRRVEAIETFRIHRTEVTNAAYSRYGAMATVTGRASPSYPSEGALAGSREPDRPVGNIDHQEASDYCRFLGLGLPTAAQWEKAARGGLYLDAARRVRNPHPARSLPWGLEPWTGRANLDPDTDGFEGAAPVGSFPGGASPYGLLDMVGNVQEWVVDRSDNGGHLRVVRGGGFDLPPELHYYYAQVDNARDERYRGFSTGVRCSSLGRAKVSSDGF